MGCDDIVGEANQVLFVTGGESYRLSEPLPGGCAELVITPGPGILTEIAHMTGVHLPLHPLFRRRSWTAKPSIQSLRAHVLYWATGVADVDDLAAEELVLTLLRSALVADALPNDPPDASRRSAVSLAGSAAAVPSLRSQPPAQARSRSETRACGFQ